MVRQQPIPFMKTEFVNVNETRKNLLVEIPSSVVDAEIDRVARDYTKAARIPGFRPGKVPARLVRQKYRDQILHDVAHELIPRAVDDALREHGVEPIDTPDVRDVVVEEGQPLKFTASFETVPPIDPGDCSTIRIRRPAPVVDDGAVDQALERLRQRAARFEPIEERGVEGGDTVVVDLLRRTLTDDEAGGDSDRHEDVSVEIGARVNPPGFDEQLAGLRPGDAKTFTVAYPAEYAIAELAGSRVEYDVAVKAIRRRVVPALDDEFAKDLGEFGTLAELRDRVQGDIQREAAAAADRQVRGELLSTLASRVTVEVPSALVEREMDRRVEEFVQRLMEQRIDPRQAKIDWTEFRTSQRDAAREAVRSALVLDEVARRESLSVSREEVEQEVVRYAERTGRNPAAVRAQLAKEGGLGRVSTGLRREKAVDFLLSCATIEHT
jgi:trigger factor